jgi:hypothetical protein
MIKYQVVNIYSEENCFKVIQFFWIAIKIVPKRIRKNRSKMWLFWMYAGWIWAQWILKISFFQYNSKEVLLAEVNHHRRTQRKFEDTAQIAWKLRKQDKGKWLAIVKLTYISTEESSKKVDLRIYHYIGDYSI